MFRGNNSIDATLRNFFNEILWKGDLTQNCSIATSLQYCANIEDNWAVSLAYRSWMAWMWMTMDTGNNYALVYNNAPCVRDTVSAVLNYWRIVDSAIGIQVSALLIISSFLF